MSGSRRCEVCGEPFAGSSRKRFCSAKCRYRDRDERRDREADRLRSVEYYAANRDRVLARVKNWQAMQRLSSPPKPPRLCRCGSPTVSQRHRYCDACREKAALRRAGRRHPISDEQRTRRRAKQRERTTTQRGYGAMHQALRKQWAEYVETGQVRCARCGEPIIPGSRWDLGHDDLDRTRYRGPEHVKCNRATRARRRVRSQAW